METQYASIDHIMFAYRNAAFIRYIFIELPTRFLRFLCARKLLSWKKINELSLNAIISNLNPEQPYPY